MNGEEFLKTNPICVDALRAFFQIMEEHQIGHIEVAGCLLGSCVATLMKMGMTDAEIAYYIRHSTDETLVAAKELLWKENDGK